jgi:hypothetical protein
MSQQASQHRPEGTVCFRSDRKPGHCIFDKDGHGRFEYDARAVLVGGIYHFRDHVVVTVWLNGIRCAGGTTAPAEESPPRPGYGLVTDDVVLVDHLILGAPCPAGLKFFEGAAAMARQPLDDVAFALYGQRVVPTKNSIRE